MAHEAGPARRVSILVVVGVGMAVVGLLVAGALAVLADSGEPEVVAKVRFDTVRTDASGRSLLVSFVGSQAGDGPCGADYGARVDEEADRVVVGLRAVEDNRPKLSDNEACPALGFPRTLVVDLAEPLAGRPVVDRVSGLAHRPFDALAYEVEEVVTIQGAEASVVHLKDGPNATRSVLWVSGGVGVRIDSAHQQGQERLDTAVLVDIARSLG